MPKTTSLTRRLYCLLRGVEACIALLEEAGLTRLSEGLPPPPYGPIESGESTPSSLPPSRQPSDDNVLSEEEARHEEQLLKFLADSGLRATPEAPSTSCPQRR